MYNSMLNRYLIYERYEYWSRNGKAWTDWFKIFNTPYAKTEEELKPVIKKLKAFVSDIDKHTKLKHEFEIRYVDLETLPKSHIKYSKKGRPSKSAIEKAKYEYDNYWKIFIEEYDRRNKGNS